MTNKSTTPSRVTAPRSLLPQHATPLEKALEQSCAIRCERLQLDVSQVYNADTCPLVLLPWLAWAYHIPSWDNAWSEVQKRSAIQQSILINRKKGTAWAVKAALQTARIQAELIEWWQETPKAKPYTFTTRVWLNDHAPAFFADETLFVRLLDIVNEYKNVRSHYQLKVGAKFTQGLVIKPIFSYHGHSHQQAKVSPVAKRPSQTQISTTLLAQNHATMQQQATTRPVPKRPSHTSLGLYMGMQFRATLRMETVL